MLQLHLACTGSPNLGQLPCTPLEAPHERQALAQHCSGCCDCCCWCWQLMQKSRVLWYKRVLSPCCCVDGWPLGPGVSRTLQVKHGTTCEQQHVSVTASAPYSAASCTKHMSGTVRADGVVVPRPPGNSSMFLCTGKPESSMDPSINNMQS